MSDTIHHDAPEEGSFHLEWIEIARILLVFLAAAAVWIQLWEPFSAIQHDRNRRGDHRRLSHLSRSVRIDA